MTEKRKLPWPHAPVHRLEGGGVFMVTTGTYRKVKLFKSSAALNLLHAGLLSIADKYQWSLEAWAVFANHYHFVGRSPDDPDSLVPFLRELHSRTAVALNELDNCPGRTVWSNYWDTKLTHQNSYLARLNYVHQNAVKHGLVTDATQYPWCSARWFEKTATRAQIKTIYSFKTDRLQIKDDY